MILRERVTNGLNISIEVENATEKEKLLIRQAMRIMSQKLNSNGFRQFCEQYKFTYTTTTGRFWWKEYHKHHQNGFKFPNGLDGIGVYHTIMSGAETLRPEVDNEMDITLVVDRRNKRGVLGYTYPSSLKQWMYSWLLRTTPERVAGNLVHEWCHKLGFKHKHRYNSTRKHSVPYAVGDYVSGISR